MNRSRTEQLLEDWDMVSNRARRPSSSPRPSFFRGVTPVAGAIAAIVVVALAAAVLWISQPRVPGGVGGGASPTPIATASPSTGPSQTPTTTFSPTPTAVPTEALGPFSCTLPILMTGSASGSTQAQPTAVRVGTHAGYDRIVFEYGGAVTPSLRIQAVSPPFTHDPSGLPMTVAGSSFLQITLEGIVVGYTGTTDFKVSYPVLVELARQGEYEGVQSWIVGLNKTTCVRVFQLSSPTRLVIDLQQ